MHIVVCVKEVLDPDGVNNYALWGRLKLSDDERGIDMGADIPRFINAYDEQAVEAALRIRDAGTACTITVLAVGGESTASVLRRCVALGADGAIQILDPDVTADGFRTARLLAATIHEVGDVDLVLCGRQGSDYDQGAVPAVLAELLDASFVAMAKDVRTEGEGVRVTRVTPMGDEIVDASLPAVITVSNELGAPRYPTSRGIMTARRTVPAMRNVDELLPESVPHRLHVMRLVIPDVQGHCEIIDGDSPAAKVERLMSRLQAAGVIRD